MTERSSSEDFPSDSEDSSDYQLSSEDSEDSSEASDTCSDSDEHSSNAASLPKFNSSNVQLRIKYQFSDVLRDYEKSQVAIVDGDSLLLEVISDHRLDWEHGGQFLHLAYLYEYVLSGFKDRGALLAIVFFKDMEWVWSASSLSGLLARQMMIRHLQENTDIPVLSQFQSFLSKEWTDYREEANPCFIILSDREHCSADGAGIQSLCKKATPLLRSFLLHCYQMKIDCVLLRKVWFKINRIYGFRTVYSFSTRERIERCEEATVREAKHQVLFLKEMATKRLSACDKEEFQRSFDQTVEKLGDIPEVDFRLALTGIVISYFMNHSKTALTSAQIDLLRLFLLHVGILGVIPFDGRCHSLREYEARQCPLLIQEAHVFLDEIQLLLCHAARLLSTLKKSFSKTAQQLTDIMDGRLFYKLIWLSLSSSFPTEFPQLHSSSGQHGHVLQCLSAVWSTVCSKELPLLPLSAKNSAHPLSAIRPVQTPGNKSQKSLSTLAPSFLRELLACPIPFESICTADNLKLCAVNCSSYNAYVGDTRKSLGDSLSFDWSERQRLFEDRFHWHSGTLIADGKQSLPAFLKKEKDTRHLIMNHRDLSELDERSARMMRKLLSNPEAKYKRFLNDYAASLNGGDPLNTDPIIYSEMKQRSRKAHKVTKKRQDSMATGSSKKLPSKKAQKIIDKNTKRMEKENAAKEETRFDYLKSTLSPKALINELDKMIDKSYPEVQFKAMKEKFSLCKQEFGSYESGSVFWKTHLFMVAQELVDEYGCDLDAAFKHELVKTVKSLGFVANSKVLQAALGLSEKKREKAVKKEVESCCRFQLKSMGHLLKTKGRLAPDPRVRNFIPDLWQREVMDCVDKNESVIVSAPTSSGKTFISFYCMEKILRSNPDSVLVYVSPTKALVNQVSAVIYAQFAQRKQDLPEGKTLCGVFTRDYRFKSDNCQILVTVPEVLDILLLSISSHKWVKNIKYVIFDEIHCLGDENRGIVWERLLLLVPCPFLALSATIGNPEDFRKWIQTVQNAKVSVEATESEAATSSRVRLVVFKNSDRYAYLQKFVVAKERKEVGGTTTSLIPCHPASTLRMHQIVNEGFPLDFVMSTSETLALYDALQTAFPDDHLVQANDPETYFVGERLIDRNGAKRYQQTVQDELVRLSKMDCQSKEKVEKVLLSLRPSHRQIVAMEEDIDKVEDFTGLLLKLDAEEKLPAIVFRLDRGGCEDMVRTVIEDLEEMEYGAAARSGRDLDKEAKKRRKLEKKRKKKEEQKQRRMKSKSRQSETVDEETLADDESSYSEYDPRLCNSKYSFFNWKKTRTTQDWKKLERFYLQHSRNKWFKEGIQRGVGCHHAGMGKKERQLVEKLFREGSLKVVVATGTLALGIHMPCRTVVFAGDSPFLKSLDYRQMSGRAGRRGFDKIGNVVFFGVPWKKICQLLTSEVPSLCSGGSLNFSTILRLAMFETGPIDLDKNDLKTYHEEASLKTLSVLKNSFSAHENKSLCPVQKHFYLLGIEYLRQEGLLDRHGAPTGMAGMITHLYYQDPSNFAALSFLWSELFENIIEEDSRSFSDDCLRRMVHVLAYLFSPQIIHHSVKKWHDRRRASPSKIELPPPDEEIQQHIERHNNKVLRIAKHYIRMAKSTGSAKSSVRLPLSQIDHEVHLSSIVCDFLEMVQASARKFEVRSSFTSLSGDYRQVEDLDDVKEFFGELAYGLPILEISGSYSSFVLDFFTHGQRRTLEKWSGLTSGDVFRGMQDFYYCTKALSVSLSAMNEGCSQLLVSAFETLAHKFGSKFYESFKVEL